jgi:transcriptional regulator GlxA family with amidase domain
MDKHFQIAILLYPGVTALDVVGPLEVFSRIPGTEVRMVGQMVDDEVLDWIRKVHQTTTWTTSVCTGALILGAAGILKGQPAVTHWYKMGVLKIMGARPQPQERIVQSGKIVTSAGVSAGIDMALWLTERLADRRQAVSFPKLPGDASLIWSARENSRSYLVGGLKIPCPVVK